MQIRILIVVSLLQSLVVSIGYGEKANLVSLIGKSAPVKLLRNSDKLPALPVLIEKRNEGKLASQSLYFSSKSTCPGQNIYEVSASQVVNEVAKVNCILTMQTDGESLYVQHVEGNGVLLSVLKGNELIPVESGIETFKDRRSWLLRRQFSVSQKESNKAYRSAEFRRWVLDLRNPKLGIGRKLGFLMSVEEGKPLFGSFSIEKDSSPKERKFGILEQEININNQTQMVLNSRGELVLVSDVAEFGYSKFEHFDLDTGVRKKNYGSKEVPELIQSLPSNELGNVKARYLSQVPDGFVFADRTEIKNGRLSVLHYSDSSDEINVIPIPSKDVSGLFWHESGQNKSLIVAKANTGEIVSYGNIENAKVWAIANSSQTNQVPDESFFQQDGFKNFWCGNYKLRKISNKDYELGWHNGEEVVDISMLRAVKSLDCRGDYLSVILKSAELDLRQGHVGIDLDLIDPDNYQEDGSNVFALKAFNKKGSIGSIAEADGKIQAKSSFMQLNFSGQSVNENTKTTLKTVQLVYAREALEGTEFSQVRFETSKSGGRFVTHLESEGKAFEGWVESVSVNGREFLEVGYDDSIAPVKTSKNLEE